MVPFVHCHVHSQYSILDGQASVKGMVDKAIANGMKGMALTDHGNMFGIKEFTDYVNSKNSVVDKEIKALEKQLKEALEGKTDVSQDVIKAKLKEAKDKVFIPMVGCEAYIARNGLHNKRKEVKSDARGWHVILIAKNYNGYKNLIKIVSKAWVEGNYYCPRTDHEEMEKYHEDIICGSACLGGEVDQCILKGDIQGAEKAIEWYKSVFGDDFYLELMRHKPTVPNAAQDTYAKQVEVNKELVRMAKKFSVKLIATNDSHFIEEEDAEAHHRLICINTGKDLDDQSGMAYTKQEWFKTQEEMNEVFADIPQALSNTVELLSKVERYSIEHGPIMPNFPRPKEFKTEDDYLKYLTYQGAKSRYPKMTDEVKERIEFELGVIKNMGFPGYFLIVQDFTSAAAKIGVTVGPGRGSAAGSVVAYCLGITKIDPIKYDLLFERFLNPDRISLPDIDIDFDDDGRGRILNWVEDRYGKEKVAHIITYGTMAAKSAIKDVARVEHLPLSEANRLAKLVPDKIEGVKKVNLKSSIKAVPELQEALHSNNILLSETMKYAQMLEGNVRNIGVHACGVIIGRDDISDWVPVSTATDKVTGEKLLVTQYEGKVIESTGLIKMDFLGLKTLSIIDDALENIKLSKGVDVDIDNVSLEDEKTYKLYSEGRTIGTFQFESPGMQKHLRNLQPTKFEDLIAMNALYRPGPMQYIPTFIARKQGREPIEYDIPVMEKYLKETYGITVYQEQVMLLSRLLANFTRGESDALRKAMGKKLKDKLDHMKPKFIEGGKSNGHDEKTLNKIWADWESFASYAFNKSHATCYSLIAYQTAWLKANYPPEYMAAILTRNLSNITDVTKYMEECKSMKIQVLGPDVNESNYKFTVNKKGNIRFGLGAVKGVGEGAVAAIVNERNENGPYRDVFDFLERVKLTACNKRCIQSIALAGGFDSMNHISREQFDGITLKGENFLDVLMRYGVKYQDSRMEMTTSLFAGMQEADIVKPTPPTVEPWSDLERLNKEKELVGMYLSAHPLDNYSAILKYACNTTMSQIASGDLPKNADISFAGMVTSIREITTKRGDLCGFVKVEDYSSSAEIPFWPKDYIRFKNFLHTNAFLYFNGNYVEKKWKQGEFELSIKKIELLSDVSEKVISNVEIDLPLSVIDKSFVDDLVGEIERYPGKCKLNFNVSDFSLGKKVMVDLFSRKLTVRPDKKFIDYVEQLEDVSLKMF